MRLEFVDSHTGGEPTRTILSGWPIAVGATPVEVRELMSSEQSHLRAGTISEPRGSDVLVGAVLMPAIDPKNAFGLVFYNSVGPLLMCGHGTIGVVASLRFLNRLQPGIHQIETPVGVVAATLGDSGEITIQNVVSYRFAKSVEIDVPDFGTAVGDIAYGGNWFYLVKSGGPVVRMENIAELLRFSIATKLALKRAGITGADGAEIDHVEVFDDPVRTDADSKNFVLCPGNAYDRSPCGTGTSAKLACLASDGVLEPGKIWTQESITGSTFRAWYKPDSHDANAVLPYIAGSASVTAEGELIFEQNDEFRWGIELEAGAGNR